LVDKVTQLFGDELEVAAVFVLHGFVGLSSLNFFNVLIKFFLEFFIEVNDGLVQVCDRRFKFGFEVVLDFVGYALEFRLVVKRGGRAGGR